MPEKMEAELYKYSSEIEDMLASDIRKMTETLSAMGGKIGHVREISSALDAAVRGKDAEIERLTAENEALQSVKAQQARYDKMGLDAADLSRLIRIYETKIAECEKKESALERAKNEFEAEKQSIIDARNTAERRVKTLNDEVEKLTRTKDKYADDLNKANAELERAREALTAFKGVRQALQDDINSAHKEQVELRTKVSKLEGDLAQATKIAAADIDHLKTRLGKKDEEIKKKDEEIERLKSDLKNEKASSQEREQREQVGDPKTKSKMESIFEDYVAVAVDPFLELWKDAGKQDMRPGSKATQFFYQVLKERWINTFPELRDLLQKFDLLQDNNVVKGKTPKNTEGPDGTRG